MSGHPRDNKKDRANGEYWERQFCLMAAEYSKLFTQHQLDRSSAAAFYGRWGNGWGTWLLPDVTIWSAPGEHHEIKHKDPTRDGCYGLEVYRMESLVRFANATGQRVLYTIHDWRHAGCQSSDDRVENRIEDWFFADIADLSRSYTKRLRGPSYVRSGERPGVPTLYWRATEYFRPLSVLWVPPLRAVGDVS
jgi:hypothetical protein